MRRLITIYPWNTVNRILALLLLLAVHATASAFADIAAIVADVRAHRFESVEAELGAVDQAFRSGKIAEYDLLDTYKAFYRSDDDFSVAMADWRQQRPASAIAHLASGTYMRKQGEQARGQGPFRDVSEDARQLMHRQFDAAKTELWRSWELSPGSFLVLLNLMNIAQFEKDDVLADKVLTLGIKAYPQNLLIRARYLQHLSPRWGGSMNAMDAFIDQARKSGLPANLLQLLDAIRSNEQGCLDQDDHGDRALAAYRRALVLTRTADPRFVTVYLPHSLARCSPAATGDDFTCH